MFKTKSATTSAVLRSIGPLVPNLEELKTRTKTALVRYKITHSLNSECLVNASKPQVLKHFVALFPQFLKSVERYRTLWYNFSSVANFWKKNTYVSSVF